MKRRDFVGWTAGASGLLLLDQLFGCGAGSGGDPGKGTDSGIDGGAGSELADTGPPLPNTFPGSMVRASREELDVPLVLLSGKLPPDIYGHAFIVAGLPWGDGAPVVNGDGMIYRIDFGTAQPLIRTRLCKTPCYYADRATAGKTLAFQNKGFVRIAQGVGIRNEANTAFATMGDRLLVTFDGGRPYELDPVSLELVTPVGWTREWTPGLPDFLNSLVGGPFQAYFSTAHPAYDEHTRELYLINYVPAMPLSESKTFLVRWDGAGALERWEVKTGDGKAAAIDMSAHQVGVTENYVVLCDTAFLIESEQLSDPNAVRAERPDTTFYLVARADLKAGSSTVTARKVVIPREIAHFIVDYDDAGGRITLHTTHGSGWLASEWVRKDDQRADGKGLVRADLAGMLVTSSDQTPIARYVIDSGSGQVIDTRLTYDDALTWSVALYTHRGPNPPGKLEHLFWSSVGFQPELLTSRVYDLSKEYKYRKTPLHSLPFAEGRRPALFRTSASAGDKANIDGWVFPPGRAVSSPQFVPASGKSDPLAGYIVCTVVSDDKSTPSSSGDEIWIFDAAGLSKGPLARLGHPLLDLGYTLHTTWMPTIAPRKATYHVPVRADYGPLVAKASAEVKQLFETEIYPHFP